MNGQGLLRVVVVGAAGRMGKEAMKSLTPDQGFEIVGAVARSAEGKNAQDIVGPLAPDLVFESALEPILNRTPVDVVVDLSNHAVALSNAKATLAAGAHLVLGATGLSDTDLMEIDSLAKASGKGAIYAPNFAIGAVLMMQFAAQAAKWLPDVEIIEMHHDRKEDAPSGTALHTADLIIAARTEDPTPKPKSLMKLEGARGAEKDGVFLHSVRLPGLLAHQQVIFGGPGEVLTIRHDAMDRSVYMGGLKLCVKRVSEHQGLRVGLDKLLFG